jgi:hypothetical protein
VSEFSDAMTRHDDERERWQRAVNGLKARFDADHRNHRMLSVPWKRAAHSMVQGWRNITSQGRLGYIPKPRREITQWDEAARSMKASLDARRRTRLKDQSTWQFWAGHLPRVACRYIPKARRGRPAP